MSAPDPEDVVARALAAVNAAARMLDGAPLVAAAAVLERHEKAALKIDPTGTMTPAARAELMRMAQSVDYAILLLAAWQSRPV